MKNLLFLIVLSTLLAPESQINLDAEKSTLIITGTSSLHAWDMHVNAFDASGDITDSEILQLEVTVESNSMKSGKNIMDGKAYDAVQAEDYPMITFKSERLIIEDKSITGPGTLTIAKESRSIDFAAQIVGDTEQEMRLQGSVALKMTDFNIKPPTAMFGTLKTGDEVVINYDIFLNK